MTAAHRENVSWHESLVELLSLLEESELSEGLAAILFARGCHALEGGAELAEDDTILTFASDKLLEAALYPGPDELTRDFGDAVPGLGDVDDGQARASEEVVADVFDERDRIQVRKMALEALGLSNVAADVEQRLEEVDEILLADPSVLEDLAYLRDSALENVPHGINSIWRRLPDPLIRKTTGVQGTKTKVTDEELVLVAADATDPGVQARVAAAITEDDEVRSRYEEIAADFQRFESIKDALPGRTRRAAFVPWSPTRVVAEERLLAAAAASKKDSPFERPPAEALHYVFHDDSELYARVHEGAWVVELFCSRDPVKKRISGDGVLETWSDTNSIGVIAKPGTLEVTCGNDVRLVELPPVDA